MQVQSELSLPQPKVTPFDKTTSDFAKSRAAKFSFRKTEQIDLRNVRRTPYFHRSKPLVAQEKVVDIVMLTG